MFDRFPRLKVVLAETGVGWLPHFLEHMDDHWWRNRVWTESQLEMLPSHYYASNFMCSFIREPFAVINRHSIGVDTMMWSSDHPHHRHDWPYSRRVIDETSSTWRIRIKMICGNAIELYKLNPLRNDRTHH